MKLLPLYFSALSAQCPDTDLQKLCSDKCTDLLNECVEDCGSDTGCQSRCQATWLDCLNECPCNSGCPNGCMGCSNPVCGGTGYGLILNERWGSSNRAYSLNLATDEIRIAQVSYNDFAFDMEDTCTVIFRGQTWFLGGYFNERKIANLVGCNVVPKSYVLTVGHIDGVYGSCGALNNEVYMCFGHENLGEDVCTRWDGENQTVVQQRSTKYHDWSSMINYQDQLMTVGGCGSIIDCNNMVEFYTEEGGWKTGANFPRWEIYGHTLTTDGAGIYLFGGKVRGAVNSQVYRLLDGEWSELGYVKQVLTGALVNSAFQMGRNAYVGKEYLEKFTLTSDNVESESIYAPDTNDLNLYYSPMIFSDTIMCA